MARILGFLFFAFALSAIWYIFQRAKNADARKKHALEERRFLARLPREMGLRHQSGKRGVDLIQDPREAAGLIAMTIAKAAGAVTPEHAAILSRKMGEYFGLNMLEAIDWVMHLQWMSEGDVAAPSLIEHLAKFVKLQANVGEPEIAQLDDILTSVARANGEISDSQWALIRLFRDTMANP